ncbi:tetratricopeptide repeat protein [Nostoc sp. 'Peltigera membranacea cyanobiont' N6]|uniref:tetratricopeptide repeat protein n=1 Tax=Nostoc sp. 'Peltigera membranacea cyanobiont' N6 TaxID=1261031 RepID=UPI000D0C0DCE|nr:tetratricopeptide repeat protein [Nostoc sp. 'Peltigera membranacea cyanobiont' N6]AVH63800.1 TPR repeat-containing protein [Nostoc sp. 'Peltigera membranacea cyanobiont' N6]
MKTNIEKNATGEYMDSNHIIFWSDSHQENKIGIYMMGGCDLPSVFSCVPLIKPILKGTCCIIKEGQIEKSRSDILLQNLKKSPQNLLAPVLEKFYLPNNFFENQLSKPDFCVSHGSGIEEFPKQVVILSIAADVARVVYQHREHGFLIDPSGWWNNQRMDLMLRDLSSANWFRKYFVSLGRMTLETFIENLTQLIQEIRQVTNAYILVFNTLTIEPGNIIHNYQFVKRPESLRRREFNLALIELSRKLNFWIVDVDKVLKQSRTKNMIDFVHFPVELYQPIGQEVFKILEELEIFNAPSQLLGLNIKKLLPQKHQTQTLLESLQAQLDQKNQELEAQQLETLQAKAEIGQYRESLQQVQIQVQIQIEQLQTQLQQTQAQLQQTQGELQQSQSQLHTSQTELVQSQSDLQQTQEQSEQIEAQLRQTQGELQQSQSQLHTSQTELVQLKSYLQQTQGVEGVMSYYRSRIAFNTDDIQLYHQALEVIPDDAQIHLQLGNALVRQNRLSDAIATYQTALQFHPNNFEIHLELAKALEKDQKSDEAIASYQRAIELNPDYSWSHKHLGDILAERGQLSGASLSYRRALQLQPRIF